MTITEVAEVCVLCDVDDNRYVHEGSLLLKLVGGCRRLELHFLQLQQKEKINRQLLEPKFCARRKTAIGASSHAAQSEKTAI